MNTQATKAQVTSAAPAPAPAQVVYLTPALVAQNPMLPAAWQAIAALGMPDDEIARVLNIAPVIVPTPDVIPTPVPQPASTDVAPLAAAAATPAQGENPAQVAPDTAPAKKTSKRKTKADLAAENKVLKQRLASAQKAGAVPVDADSALLTKPLNKAQAADAYATDKHLTFAIARATGAEDNPVCVVFPLMGTRNPPQPTYFAFVDGVWVRKSMLAVEYTQATRPWDRTQPLPAPLPSAEFGSRVEFVTQRKYAWLAQDLTNAFVSKHTPANAPAPTLVNPPSVNAVTSLSERMDALASKQASDMSAVLGAITALADAIAKK